MSDLEDLAEIDEPFDGKPNPGHRRRKRCVPYRLDKVPRLKLISGAAKRLSRKAKITLGGRAMDEFDREFGR